MANPTSELGTYLRELRLRSRLSQRDLALLIGFHEAGIANIERGERAPGAQFLTRVIAALKLKDDVAASIWALYRRVPGSSITAAERDSTLCPYRGLSAFREEDAALFHGRRTTVRRIVAKLNQAALVAVVGASGSGKSSVVFAGVVPALRTTGHWDVAMLRPGPDPRAALLAALGRSREPADLAAAIKRRSRRAGVPLLVIIDQFEELYTHAPNEESIGAFLDDLVGCVTSTYPHSVKLLLTFRGDFYGRVIGHRGLSDLLQDRVVHLPPMSRNELRSVITEPAKESGLTLESGLVERILDDAGTEPGNLPLLEFTLTRLWDRRTDAVLTTSGYEQVGRLPGAISARAEEVYTSLSPEQQYAARQLLVRLVQVARPEEDGNDARRRTPIAELIGLPGVEQVIAGLAAARLVVTDSSRLGGPTVELAHEAIIRSWERLRGWLVEDRQFLLWQQRTRQWMQDWHRSTDPRAFLLRGGPLDEARRWFAAKGREAVSPDLLPYLDASEAEAVAQHQRQLVDLVDQLAVVVPSDVPGLLAKLSGHSDHLAEHARSRLGLASLRERWRLRLLLVQTDPQQFDALLDDLPRLWPDEQVAIRDALRPPSPALADKLWAYASDAHGAPLLAIAVLLADSAADDPRWADIADEVAHELVQQNQLHLRAYVDALRAARLHLLPALFTLFADDRELRSAIRETRAVVLLDLAADQPELLARMATAALPQNYEAILAELAANPSPDAIDALKAAAHAAPTDEMDESDRVRLGRRRAAALCTMMRLGVTPDLDQALAPARDLELMTQFSVQAADRRIDPSILLSHLATVREPLAQQALLLALGEYGSAPHGIDEAIARLNDDDAGVRAAAHWLRRRIGASTKPMPRAAYDPTGRRSWFTVHHDSRDLTFVVFRPGAFRMGSPEGEAERSDYEGPRHLVTLTRSFALADREVTRAEFEHFMEQTKTVGLPNIDEWSPLGSEPVVAPTWFEAQKYLEWLNVLAQRWNGDPGLKDVPAFAFPKSLPETAAPPAIFRLPTEAEWEYACRAGTDTPYNFGSDRTLLDEYGWFADNSRLKTHEAAIKRPNSAGLFNIHGQCWEWCQDGYGPYDAQPVADPIGHGDSDRMVLRGGCWNLGARYARSACRNAHIPSNRNYYITFRLAMTIPEIDSSWQPSDPNPLPWTG
ncbi:SUMF1/EgtB/PvdO family nonheme iron enzyme [Hamadaea sp. NPDC051192]|uniref:nSTAND1 domain-containing NTPase n=1 Tax=Hamadaea sp. NPDC051192 TaxID=3154940 RepID=UPI003420AE15